MLAHFKPRGALRRIGRRRVALARSAVDRRNRRSDGLGTPSTPATARSARSSGRSSTWPPSIAASSTRSIWTSTCGTTDSRRCAAAWSSLRRKQIIDEIQASGLRGRGGAGFPTGLKWAKVRAATGELKYVVCNGDEGDPGAFMDRMLLESFPYRIIEGMAIAARAVGARKGFFYIRAEYPLAVERIRCRARALSAARAVGSRRDGERFRVRICRSRKGPGRSSAAKKPRCWPRSKGAAECRGCARRIPPTSGSGTSRRWSTTSRRFAMVPWILRHGAEAFAAIGTPKSPGTKVFALAGKVRRGGLIEVPMGITLRQIVEEIGGGVADAPCAGMARHAGPHPRPLSQEERERDRRRLKAVQIGGPSGGCVPAELADTPVDYEALAGVGAIMGSGGLVVLDDSDCMVDIARYFLRFTQDQSCGKCTLCRVGTRRMLDILDRICDGHGQAGDLDELEQLAVTVKAGSICGLGRTAPNPVLSTLRYFRHEYEAHIAGRCPAGRCKSLIHYRVTDDCIGCTLCAQHCPADAIPMTPYAVHEHRPGEMHPLRHVPPDLSRGGGSGGIG